MIFSFFLPKFHPKKTKVTCAQHVSTVIFEFILFLFMFLYPQRIYILFFLFLGFLVQSQKNNVVSLTSPNGKVRLVTNIIEGQMDTDSLYYYVLHEKDTIIEKSALGIALDSIRSSYTYLDRSIENVSHEYTLVAYQLEVNHSDTLAIEFRLYNDGVAYKYRFPNSPDRRITKEYSSFNLPQGKVWMQPYDKVTKWSPGYEKPFQIVNAGTSSENKEGWCFPILFESINQNRWSFISEAGLDGNYPAMHLEPDAPDGNYSLRRPEPDEANALADDIILTQNWHSTWRFIVLGNKLADIYDTKMVERLVGPPKGNYEWVKPGIASWSWWSDHDSSRNPAKLKKFIDLADEMNWDYSLIDANWDTMPRDTLKSLISYASRRDVGIWLWYNSGGPHNSVTESPRDKMNNSEVRRSEFAWLKKLGVEGIKIDFFQSDKTPIIKQYLDIIKDASDFEIMLNFHGCTLPRGWSYTYPHVLTMEGVNGSEAYSFNEQYADIAPKQNTIYPFTRNLMGPMDYTPVTFSKYPNGRLTTRTHELALSVIFTSGIQHFADSPESYLKESSFVKEFLSSVPVTWDESRLLDSFPGSHAVIARRKGGAWYIAGINGINSIKKVMVDIPDILNREILIYQDDNDNISSKRVIYSKPMTFSIPPFGGFVIKVKQN